MRPVLSCEQMRAFEAALIGRGVPSLVLMENAGRGAAHLIGLRGRPRQGGPKAPAAVGGSCVRCADEAALSELAVLVLVGPGNNGGDGLVVARHLWGRGAQVRVLALGDAAASGDRRTMLDAWLAVGGQVEPLDVARLQAALVGSDLVVDALLGTGLGRPVETELASCIELLNSSKTPVVALDLPSGLDADTGSVLGVAVQAEHTVCFGHLKTGLLTTGGHAHAGRITISQIGVPSRLPPDCSPSAWLLEEADLLQRLQPRSPTAHKVSAGRVVVLAGSPGTLGAARLVGRAVLRAGAGLCTLAGLPETTRLLDREVVELMTWTVDLDALADTEQLLAQADSLVVGPGLGRGAESKRLVRLALAAQRPTVLDADGLRQLEGGLESLQGHPALVLTPHPGEAAELLGSTSAAVERDRFGAARRLAERAQAVVVLKGSRSIVAAPARVPFVSAWGSAALATAGSGDVLAGLLGGLLASALVGSEGAFEATLLAVGLHALAGERWSETGGDAGLLASEIADEVVQVRARLLASTPASRGA